MNNYDVKAKIPVTAGFIRTKSKEEALIMANEIFKKFEYLKIEEPGRIAQLGKVEGYEVEEAELPF